MTAGGDEEYRDSAGLRLVDYPRPSVAVDVAVLTVRHDTLGVVAVAREGQGTRLPGTFLHPGERLADAAARVLHDKVGLDGVAVHQLQVFDAPDRDDRGWVVSVGHGAALPAERVPDDALLLPLPGGRLTVALQYDHAAIVARAVEDLRARYGRELDPDGLLAQPFTVLALRRLYEAVFGHPLVPDTFRRLVVEHLEETGELRSAGAGRPAATFRLRPAPYLPPSAVPFLVGGRTRDRR